MPIMWRWWPPTKLTDLMVEINSFPLSNYHKELLFTSFLSVVLQPLGGAFVLDDVESTLFNGRSWLTA